MNSREHAILCFIAAGVWMLVSQRADETLFPDIMVLFLFITGVYNWAQNDDD